MVKWGKSDGGASLHQNQTVERNCTFEMADGGNHSMPILAHRLIYIYIYY